MESWQKNPFPNGSTWIRADFHLHTKADKEFSFTGEETSFVSGYVDALKKANIRVAVLTNHNKFDLNEFKAIRKKSRKDGICVLPGVELSIKDGKNGVHTLIVFSDEWVADGNDYINPFLVTAFSGRTPDQYEHENSRSNDDIIETLKKLESNNKDFFIVFAHVEQPSGLWNELDGGRLEELAREPLIQKYCLGFQKVRTHDKADKKCRTKVQNWWQETYPAEVEGSDAKSILDVGKGKSAYIKVSDLSYQSVKYALLDHTFRVGSEIPQVKHSHINAVRFEGGLLNGMRVPFSPHLNCIIGIRGSGKSAVLEAIRYALDVPFGQGVADKDYKDKLIPHVLQSGGKVVVEAVDKHGMFYEIHRIYRHQAEVKFDGEPAPGVSIRETVVWKPLYFGQKDLAAAGKVFGNDLVEKLVGDSLKTVREDILTDTSRLIETIRDLDTVSTDVEKKDQHESDLVDIQHRIKQFEKHGIQEKLQKQVDFTNDLSYLNSIQNISKDWYNDLIASVDQANESIDDIEERVSKHNADIFDRFHINLKEIRASIDQAREIANRLHIKKQGDEKDTLLSLQSDLKQELVEKKDSLKEEFAQIERDLAKELADDNAKTIEPNEYVDLQSKKTALEKAIAELSKSADSKRKRERRMLTALSVLNDSWHKEFISVQKALESINKSQSSLKVDSVFKGDKSTYIAKMEETFRGNNIQKSYYKSLSEAYPDFGEMYRSLEEASKLTKSKSTVFTQIFLENMEDLLAFQVPNSYSVSYHGKDLRSHSLGQRASAMMLFILSQEDCDLLLIDQPEDDLDGQSIYEEVVKLVREIKTNQQFIFATHNANFPVLGDAEMISSCNLENDEIGVDSAGIDCEASQGRIVGIMEGGKEAFERRKNIYQQWNVKEQSDRGVKQ